MKNSDPNNIEKHVSANDILLKLTKKPMPMEDFLSIERYFTALKNACLIDVIGTSHFYDKQIYDFYFIIEDSSRNWGRKIILKKSMADLIVKYRVIEYLIIKEYQEHNPQLVEHD